MAKTDSTMMSSLLSSNDCRQREPTDRNANHPPAVVLLGGKGTRIAALHPGIPKALVPVLGRPFLEWQLDALAALGITRIHLAAGHLADRLSDYLSTALPPRFASLDITLSVEPAPLGTAGALLHALPALPPHASTLFVLNGDTLFPALSPGLFASILSRTAALPPDAAHLLVAPIDHPDRYGLVDFDPATGLVAAFREKAPATTGHINAGAYLFPTALLRTLPPPSPATPLSMETDLFPTLVAARRLYAHPIPPPLLDMGTPDGLSALESALSCQGST